MGRSERCKLLIVSGTLGYLIGGESCTSWGFEMADKKDDGIALAGVFIGAFGLVFFVSGFGAPIGIPLMILGGWIFFKYADARGI
jgi:hypothetical protein